MLNRIFELFAIIIRPQLWVSIIDFNAYCDAWCRNALKNPEIKISNEYRAIFNGKEVWIANKFYGFEFTEVNVRPSRYIGWKMMQLIEAFAIENSKIREYFKE